MIASTSDKGAPARINRKMLSTDAEENRPDSFRASFSLNTRCTEDCVIDSINPSFLAPLRERQDLPLAQSAYHSVELEANTCQLWFYRLHIVRYKFLS